MESSVELNIGAYPRSVREVKSRVLQVTAANDLVAEVAEVSAVVLDAI